jgi:hypothetical protein
MHASSSSSLQQSLASISTFKNDTQHTFNPGLRVKLPRNFISAPDTLSPMVAWRLWWCTGAAVVWPWRVPPVVRTVLVVVVVVVVAGARVARVLRPPPRRRVLRLGRAVVRVARVVRGAVRRVEVRGMV